MVIFNSYVKLPEGKGFLCLFTFLGDEILYINGGNDGFRMVLHVDLETHYQSLSIWGGFFPCRMGIACQYDLRGPTNSRTNIIPSFDEAKSFLDCWCWRHWFKEKCSVETMVLPRNWSGDPVDFSWFVLNLFHIYIYRRIGFQTNCGQSVISSWLRFSVGLGGSCFVHKSPFLAQKWVCMEKANHKWGLVLIYHHISKDPKERSWGYLIWANYAATTKFHQDYHVLDWGKTGYCI